MMDRCNYCPRYELNKRQNAECKTCNFFSIVAPEGATNGDMIKALFPQWDLREEIGYEYKLFGETHKFEGLVDEDWWNAPYKKEVEE